MSKILYRKVFDKVKNLLFSTKNKIIVLIGPRQVGKTTIMKYFFNLLKKQKQKVIFLDLDIYENYTKINSYTKFINFLFLNGYKKEDKNFFYVFLDEFQHYPDLIKILKNIYDNHPNIKLLISGSSSILIKGNIQESLAGRKRIIEILPLDFQEFLLFRGRKDLFDSYENIKNLKGENLFDVLKEFYDYFFEFLIRGGYPEIALENDFEERKKIFDDIFDLFIKKDLVDYLKLDKIKIIKDIIIYLAINHGQRIQYSSISSLVNASIYTVKNYIEILKENFLIFELKPYYTNKNLEITKLPKLYFLDSGVRNYFIKNFVEINLREDKGRLFEAVIISEFLKKSYKSDNLKYWRDKNKREVDLVVDEIVKIIPYEIKFKTNIKKKDLLGLKAFMKIYNTDGYLINLGKSLYENGINYLLPFQI